jgi:hypothetical protein
VGRDLVDVVCPMIYTPDARVFVEEMAAARDRAGTVPVWAGIGAYRLAPAQTIENILAARRHGANGIVLFSYDSLTAAGQAHPEYLREVSETAFADTPKSQPQSR